MRVSTRNGVYEVRESSRTFRRVPATGAPGPWIKYDRLGPLRTGEPARFFSLCEEAGRSLRYRLVTTSPVVEVSAA